MLEEPYIRINIDMVGLLSSWDIVNNVAKKRSNLYN
jgi:hypothetical protein